VDEKVWRTGKILKDCSSTTLVKADIEDRRIFIWVGGDEHKRHDFFQDLWPIRRRSQDRQQIGS
jgi:hypothetical protein